MSTALEQLYAAADVRPNDGYRIFEIAESEMADVAVFNIRPLVFNLPERADDTNTDLFVVVEGRLELSCDGDQLLTQGFSTKAAYFRRTEAILAHIYGAHYDFALDEIGHPIFHMQMRSFIELERYVRENYTIRADSEDCMSGVLRNVRLPSAQMDIFSFFIQICADHLLFERSGKEERAVFNGLLKKSESLKGAGFKSLKLNSDSTRSCFRASHWYPVLA